MTMIAISLATGGKCAEAEYANKQPKTAIPKLF
jgi:hypothetical protein